MQTLTIAVVQTALHWADAAANRAALSQRLRSLTGVDLIILPEMFTTGFSMNARELAEPEEGPTLAWMREQAHRAQAVVTGSLIVVENGLYYNRLLWVRPDGTHSRYDKRHLFRMAGENLAYDAGEARLVVTLKGFRICPLICYDLRFPIWSRNRGDYDVLLYIANWPERRREAWNTLLKARAIENLAYCIGVNRIGEDGNGLAYVGESCVIEPTGAVLFHAGSAAMVHVHRLSLETLQAVRMTFPAHLDADDFELIC